MEAKVLFGVGAILMGCVGCGAGVLVVVSVLRRHLAASAAQGGSRSVQGLFSWRLRNGYGFAVPVADILLRVGPVRAVAQDAAKMLGERGMETSAESALSVFLVGVASIGLCVGVLMGSFVAAAAALAGSCAVLVVFSASAKDKRHDAIRDAIPDALESMSVCFGSGFTLLQTFRQVAQDVGGPLGEVFSRSSHMLETGSSTTVALEELRTGAQASELAFVAVALDVQHQSGGAMRQVLAAATEAVKSELALRRFLRVQTAQAKLSARVVIVMPFILVLAFSLVSPDYLMPFFGSVYGYALLALAVIMQVAGIVLVRRALNVEGVS